MFPKFDLRLNPRILLIATAITGLAWMFVVPPFEAPDEVLFYDRTRIFAQGHRSEEGAIYQAVATPMLWLLDDLQDVFPRRYNPHFRFVSNRLGQVNMFLHGNVDWIPATHLRGLYALRLLSLAWTALAVFMIYKLGLLFWGREDLAVLSAGLCLFTPQFSFMTSKIHFESAVITLGALTSLILVARARGRLGRWQAWAILAGVIVASGLGDRQAYFLTFVIPLGMTICERTIPARVVTLVVSLACTIFLSWVAFRAELLPGLMWKWIIGLSEPRWLGRPATPEYFAFEFAPKMFMSFWGWLGQPSILLPPWLYAAFLDVSVLAAAGFAVWLPRTLWNGDPGTRKTISIMLVGILCSLGVIVYANLVVDRNLWYGRWLFPMIGPIIMFLTAGMREIVEKAKQKPHVVAALTAAVAVGAALAWFGGIGNGVRSGIAANHYGDQPRLIRTLQYAVLGLALVPLIVEAVAFRKRRAQLTAPVAGGSPSMPGVVFAAAWALNLVLLFAYVWPLYRPLDEAGYVAAINDELKDKEFDRAGNLGVLATEEYPSSPRLHQLTLETLLARGNYRALGDYLNARIRRGLPPRTPIELFAVAKLIRVGQWPASAAPPPVLPASDAGADLLEANGLVQLVTRGGPSDKPEATADYLRAMGVTPVRANLRDEALLEGYSVRATSDGRREITIYFRPLNPWAGRTIWVHAYPVGSPEPLALVASPPQFDRWDKNELAWEVFQTPRSGLFDAYVGVAIDGGSGPAAQPLTRIGGAIDSTPETLLKSARFDELREYLAGRLRGGEAKSDREDLMALARAVRMGHWTDLEGLKTLPRPAADAVDALEGWALVRTELDESRRLDWQTAITLLREVQGVPVGTRMGNDGVLEGYTVRRRPDGDYDLVVYYTPLGDWRGRRIWVRAFRPRTQDALSLESSPPVFDAWQNEELAWDVFHLPGQGKWDLYVGVTGGTAPTAAYVLGSVGE